MSEIKDSGERTEFSTGAVRDMHEGKGDTVSMPMWALLRLSKHYENGSKKYGRFNYQKGIPLSSFLDSALRHTYKYLAGWDDEDHLAAAAFNILGAMEMEKTKKILIDLPAREGKKTFDYTPDSTPVTGVTPKELYDAWIKAITSDGEYEPYGESYDRSKANGDVSRFGTIDDWFADTAERFGFPRIAYVKPVSEVPSREEYDAWLAAHEALDKRIEETKRDGEYEPYGEAYGRGHGE